MTDSNQEKGVKLNTVLMLLCTVCLIAGAFALFGVMLSRKLSELEYKSQIDAALRASLKGGQITPRSLQEYGGLVPCVVPPFTRGSTNIKVYCPIAPRTAQPNDNK